MPHDNTDCFGFLIKNEELGTLSYMTDLEFCPFKFQKQKINHMIVEANYDKNLVDDSSVNQTHILRGHCEINTTLGIIEANKTDDLKTVILAHLSTKNSKPMEFKRRAEEVAKCHVFIAQKGLEIEL